MGHKAEDQMQRKFVFDKMESEWDLGSSSEIIVSLRDFNGHVGKCAEGFEGVHWGMVLEKKYRRLEFCDERELCMANTWFIQTDKRKITYSAGGFETEIDFVLKRKIKKVYKGCESDSMGTSSQAGGRRSR